jgi:membrane-associated phospholipid phosphatase
MSPRHGPVAQLLIALSPLSVILLAYGVAQWVNAPIRVGDADAHVNRWGFHLHVAGPADADRRVFDAVPSAWLQARVLDGSAHWYDAVAALVYATHFVAIPVVTGLVWFRFRDRFRAWIVSVVAFTVLGIAGYVAYPAAPPWLASDHGVIETVHRVSLLGWDALHLTFVASLLGTGQQDGNPVAAMPSLHAGAAMLLALFLWPVAGWLWRTLLLVYVPLMAVTLVYTGEHYVVDVAAGWLTALAAVAAGAAIRARSGRHRR